MVSSLFLSVPFAAYLVQTAALVVQYASTAPKASRDDDRICLASAVALDFEKNRVLDWIAYHHLMGVECFALYFDRNHCNFSDPVVSAIFGELTNSDLVTLVNATYASRPGDREGPDLRGLSTVLGGPHYIGIIDVDEFIVTDPGVSFADTVREQVGQPGQLGLYLRRWTFGTNGYEDPVDVSEKPEFFYLTERAGRKERSKQPRFEPRSGKMIYNLPSGVAMMGQHSWYQSNSTPNAYMVRPDNTAATNPVAHYIDRTKTVQPIWINHYMTGSYNECMDKASNGDHHRRRWMECKQLHPDGKEYDATVMVEDRDLADSWASATYTHRNELFPGAKDIYVPH